MAVFIFHHVNDATDSRLFDNKVQLCHCRLLVLLLCFRITATRGLYTSSLNIPAAFFTAHCQVNEQHVLVQGDNSSHVANGSI